MGKFPGHELDLWKTHPIVNFRILGHDTGRILENSSKIEYLVEKWDSKNSGAWHRPISGKFIHQFLWVSVIVKYRSHIWMSFPEIGLCDAPKFFEYHFSTKCSILDEFSRSRPVSCPIILKLTIGWVFHKSV